MEQKLLFIKMLQSGNYTMTSLCDRFGISRNTGHKLANRFKKEGESCLLKSSKSSHSTPHKTAKNIEDAIIELRKKYPDWGTRKLKVLLEKKSLQKRNSVRNNNQRYSEAKQIGL